METLWFILVALMLIAYVCLDGFDLGAGAINPLVAKTERDRRQVIRAIGPVWDGNEVWLIAAGGSLYFAFPPLYASSFSGFYLPLMMVLWLLMLRGIGIELRTHIDHPMWRSFYDFLFCGSSLLLAIFLGAAIGNVVRGVPLDQDGYFFEPLWTDFRVTGRTGILDWYTILTGLLALITLMTHGANFLAMKCRDEVSRRAIRISKIGAWLLPLFTVLSLAATTSVRPEVLANFKSRVWGLVFPALVVAGLIGMHLFRIKQREFATFLSSTIYIIGMLGGAAFALYPTLLPATTGAELSLTIYNSKAGDYALGVGLIWWVIGILLAIGYFVFLYRFFQGKVPGEAPGEAIDGDHEGY
jgi:cytochrome d ubiquinol oxidase subunit II